MDSIHSAAECHTQVKVMNQKRDALLSPLNTSPSPQASHHSDITHLVTHHLHCPQASGSKGAVGKFFAALTKIQLSTAVEQTPPGQFIKYLSRGSKKENQELQNQGTVSR